MEGEQQPLLNITLHVVIQVKHNRGKQTESEIIDKQDCKKELRTKTIPEATHFVGIEELCILHGGDGMSSLTTDNL